MSIMIGNTIYIKKNLIHIKKGFKSESNSYAKGIQNYGSEGGSLLERNSTPFLLFSSCPSPIN